MDEVIRIDQGPPSSLDDIIASQAEYLGVTVARLEELTADLCDAQELAEMLDW